MPEANTLSLQEVFCEVLENMAFMFGDPASARDLPPMHEAILEVSLAFRGPTCGTLALLAPQALAVELAANVLGIDCSDESAAEQGRDALGELMNVTLGRLLTTVAGQTAVFDLTPPIVRDVDDSRWALFSEDDDAVAVLIDDKPVLLRFSSATTPEKE